MASRSPCAACKCLRRKCTVECVFAPYFPAENPQMFINVHKVFGASNVAKLLYECITVQERVDVVNSLAYEAECRLRDPVYGSIGIISALQHRLNHVRYQLEMAKKELASYVGEETSEQIRFMEFNQMVAPAVPQSSVVIPYIPTASQEQYSPPQLNQPPPPPSTDVAPSSS